MTDPHTAEVAPPRRNLELKARLRRADEAPDWARQVATKTLDPQQQIDTYFHVRNGRLKLREIAGQGDWLVSYSRPDQPECRQSRYRLVSINDVEALKQALADTLGVLVVVEKYREIHLHHNVRIHLDRVTGLGDFLEFEAVLGPGDSLEDAHQMLARLTKHFCIDQSDLVSTSYSDLLLATDE